MISQGDEVTFQRRGGVSVDVEDVEAKYLRLLGEEIFRVCLIFHSLIGLPVYYVESLFYLPVFNQEISSSQ